ncbi:hypothetical protein B0A50_01022 [Salinomyces thailandicus]|uniref:Uncharacterized protein n=1 Tax=Salinomyces thailandicus TaxID=706561 RepID=A0A4U0UC72_9PEZI|nr:hypothetical protein B0A50_01022 [Salinomyces thailandica]
MSLLATSAIAGSVGNAIIQNKCSYDVHLAAVPAQNGGYDESFTTLSPGDDWSQQWTELSTGAGWSLKLTKDQDSDGLLQYEYTFQNDGIIWYDLSQVDGNPWNGDWMITANSTSSTCSPKQQAYRYATDDAYGMQACPADSDITVTLCSGEDQNDGVVSSLSASAEAATSQAVATGASSFATPTSTPVQTSIEATATPTTFATYVSSAAPSESDDDASSTTEAAAISINWYPATTEVADASSTSTSSVVTTDGAGVTVTEINTAVVTDVVTQTHYHNHHWGRRHGHNHA